MRVPFSCARRLPIVALLATFAVASWLALGDPGRVAAHGVQISSEPAANAQLPEPPTSISVQFSEPIEPSVTTIQLWDTSPAEIPISAAQFPADDTIAATIPSRLPMGIYTVIWRNLSTVDGHTWAGSYSFMVLGPNGEVPQGSIPTELQELAQAPSANPSTLDTVARWIVLLGTAVALGGTAYVLFVVLPAAHAVGGDAAARVRDLSVRVVLVTATIAVFLVFQGSLIQVLLQADKLGGLGKADELLTDTRLGKYLLARQALLLVTLGAVTFARFSTRSRMLTPALVLLFIAAFGVLFTQPMVSHAAGSDGAFWKIGADLLHALSASLWIGGLVHIGLAMPRWLDDLKGAPRTLFAAESFRRFSVLAAFSVLVIMVSGVLSALAQFTSFEQLWDTTYGWALVGKMAAMIPLLMVAGLNAFILQPRVVRAGQQIRGAAIDTDDREPVASLQRLLANAVRLEAALGIAVLVAVGVLTQIEPARAVAAAKAAAPSGPVTADPATRERGYFLDAAQSGGLVISLQIDPAFVGLNEFEVGVGSEFGGVGEIDGVRLNFNHEDPAIGPSELELPLSGSAKFSAQAANLSLPGTWKIDATVRRLEEDDIRVSFTVPVTAASTSESSIWDWPFDDARSTGAIVALAVGGVGVVGVSAWQLLALRRRP
jgi:copper transport protein